MLTISWGAIMFFPGSMHYVCLIKCYFYILLSVSLALQCSALYEVTLILCKHYKNIRKQTPVDTTSRPVVNIKPTWNVSSTINCHATAVQTVSEWLGPAQVDAWNLEGRTVIMVANGSPPDRSQINIEHTHPISFLIQSSQY